MAAVARPGVPRAERPHAPAQGAAARPDPPVGVVWQEGPGVDREAGRRPRRRQAAHDVRAVGVIRDEAPALDPAPHHLMEHYRGIEAGGAGHGTGRVARGV